MWEQVRAEGSGGMVVVRRKEDMAAKKSSRYLLDFLAAQLGI